MAVGTSTIWSQAVESRAAVRRNQAGAVALCSAASPCDGHAGASGDRRLTAATSCPEKHFDGRGGKVRLRDDAPTWDIGHMRPVVRSLATGDEADLRGAGSSPQAMSLALGPSLGAEAGVVVHEHPTLFHRGILAPSPWRHNRADPIHDVRGGPDGSDEPAT
jgi:hypothetical protein